MLSKLLNIIFREEHVSSSVGTCQLHGYGTSWMQIPQANKRWQIISHFDFSQSQAVSNLIKFVEKLVKISIQNKIHL